MKKSSVDILIEKRKQLDERIQMLQSREKSQARKNETRMKILVGAYILEKHQKLNTYQELVAELDNFLYKEKDRALFGLSPREIAYMEGALSAGS